MHDGTLPMQQSCRKITISKRAFAAVLQNGYGYDNQLQRITQKENMVLLNLYSFE